MIGFVSVEHAAALISALTELSDRALWATALYAGLRRGELMALRWRDVDLAGGSLHVERAYDPKARQYVEPKSRAGRRRVPIAGALRDALDGHRARLAEPGPDDLVSERAGSRSGLTPSSRAPASPGRPRASTRSVCTKRGTQPQA